MPKLINDLSVPYKKTRFVYTVSEITQDIKLILENTFGEVWVEGEISGLSRINTGTLFFNLKDDQSLLKCVMFSNYASALKFELQNGLKVICFGKISVYEKEGKYQFYVQEIEPKGIGSQQLALEQLKKRLEKEGLFSLAHKRPIPYLPAKIGVVTSLSGAAIKDILKVLERRFKDVQIIIYPVRVQGEGAKEEIAFAIKDFNQFNEKLPQKERIEVLIVTRGGGSQEDLFAFNEEIVCRAIYHSNIPIISAVGHERDVTLADLVADLRAATPSVAAELIIPKKEDLKEKIKDLETRLKKSWQDMILVFQENLEDLLYRLGLSIEHILALDISHFNLIVKKLILLNPAILIPQHIKRILDLKNQIHFRIKQILKMKEAEFTKLIGKLSSLSPLNILSRGYSITFKMPEGIILKEAKAVQAGNVIKTRLHKGEILSKVMDILMTNDKAQNSK